jgi:tRNA (mo5U34)-methyltransferase
VGLPDTIWQPADALGQLPDDPLSFLLFPVAEPRFFDAVATDSRGQVTEIQVKRPDASTEWIWGAFKVSGRTLRALRDLWTTPERRDEYIGTLVNAYIEAGGRASAVRAGTAYVDVGTIRGYREAMQLLGDRDGKGVTRT